MDNRSLVRFAFEFKPVLPLYRWPGVESRSGRPDKRGGVCGSSTRGKEQAWVALDRSKRSAARYRDRNAALVRSAGGAFRAARAPFSRPRTGANLLPNESSCRARDRPAPAALLFFDAPSQFLFGNFTYNSILNPLYRQSMFPGEYVLLRKFAFPVQQLLKSPCDLALAVGFIYFGLRPWWRAGWRNIAEHRETVALGFVLPFLFLGCLAATPSTVSITIR